MQKLLLIISFALIHSFSNPCFAQSKQEKENNRITKAIKKLPEFKQLNKRGVWVLAINVVNDSTKNIVPCEIYTMGEYDTIKNKRYFIKYDKTLKKITAIVKAN